MVDILNEKLASLEHGLRASGSLAVAYSGGLDSRFVCHTALRLKVPVLALHVTGPHIPARETREAVEWAENHGLNLRLVRLDPLGRQQVRQNGRDRCYHCKLAVFEALRAEAGNRLLCDGTNASDLTGYRPGLRALEELAVASPLAQAGLSKQEIRALARMTGMDRPDQTAQPCLFTRFNYGLSPTAETLSALDAAEERLAAALPGLSFRIRHLSEAKRIVHVLKEHMDKADAIRNALRGTAYAAAPIEPVDELSGYFDRLHGQQSETGAMPL